jgi:hypothetical protein
MKAINSKKIPDENIKKKIKSVETDDESSVYGASFGEIFPFFFAPFVGLLCIYTYCYY